MVVRNPKRRSSHAQLLAMQSQWPDFVGERRSNGLLSWYGPLKPQLQRYLVEVYWQPGTFDRPYVIIDKPAIKPIEGKDFEDIPHLLYNEDKPIRSPLCLFDPDGNEWSESDLIAETTIHWAAEWLNYYELWHLFGEWLGPSVGYESFGQMKTEQAQALKEAV